MALGVQLLAKVEREVVFVFHVVLNVLLGIVYDLRPPELLEVEVGALSPHILALERGPCL